MIDLADFDISIRDKMEKIRAKTKNNDYVNAKTFTSCYIWAKPMGIKVHIEDDVFIIKNNSHGQTAWNFPVGEKCSKQRLLNELIKIKGLRLLKLTADDVEFLNEHYRDMFVFEKADDDSEYIYDADEHAEMPGKRFANLRQLLNRFKREHKVRTEILTKENLETAKDIMSAWENGHEERSKLDTTGIEIDQFLISHYEELNLIGTLTYIDDIPSAVAIGYPIASDMCDIAETKFISAIKHLGYVTMEEFMKMFRDNYKYFNNEEDMGIAGLREYKKCLKPCMMNVFWNAYLKGENE